MEEVGLIVLGAIVGALATGGMSFYAERRRDGRARKVAARVILGDLVIARNTAQEMVDDGQWREVAWREVVKAWEAAREPFVATVKAWEWIVVEDVYRTLPAVKEATKVGSPLSEHDRDSLTALREVVDEAIEVVLPHAAPPRERARLVQEVERRAMAV